MGEEEEKKSTGMMGGRLLGSNASTNLYDTEKKEVSPTKPVVPNVEPVTTHQDLYKSTMTAPLSTADEQASKKKERRQRTLAAIIDGLSALGNVYFATRGANATGTTNLSKGVTDKWTKYWEDARKDRDAYNKGLLAAQQMDFNATTRRIERAEDAARRQKEREEDRAERTSDKDRAQRNWELTFNAGREDAAHARGMDAARLGIQQTQANIASMKARGENIAWDKYGNPHYFTDPKAADDFAMSQGTYVYDDVTETVTTDNGMSKPVTKTTTKKGNGRRINPKTYKPADSSAKKDNPMGGKKANPMG